MELWKMTKTFKIGAGLCGIFALVCFPPVLLFWDFFNDPVWGMARTTGLEVVALFVILITVLVLARLDVI
jgi:hypothetical protein